VILPPLVFPGLMQQSPTCFGKVCHKIPSKMAEIVLALASLSNVTHTGLFPLLAYHPRKPNKRGTQSLPGAFQYQQFANGNWF
jgi:hypothetical protein